MRPNLHSLRRCLPCRRHGCRPSHLYPDQPDCADICQATGTVLSRRTGQNLTTVKAMLEACRIACQQCVDECEQHAEMHEHCKVCAEACRRCEQACADLLAAIG